MNIVEYLIEERKVDPNEQRLKGLFPLSIATMHDNLQMVKYLIEVGKANPMIKDEHIGIPMVYAAAYGKLDTLKYFNEEVKIDIC